MAEERTADVTSLPVIVNKIPAPLMQLGLFQIMQNSNLQRHDLVRYLILPFSFVPATPFLMDSNKHLNDQASDNDTHHSVTTGAYCPLIEAKYSLLIAMKKSPEVEDWPCQTHLSDRAVVDIRGYETQFCTEWISDFLNDGTLPFTDTPVERDLRMIKVRHQTSSGDRNVAVLRALRSYLAFIREQGHSLFSVLILVFQVRRLSIAWISRQLFYAR
jgi:hypothetical protein